MVEQTNPDLKVSPPFTNLPSFNISALVLSFYGYKDEVVFLLDVLCRNSRGYKVKHNEFLMCFLVTWTPQITGVINFGPDI